MTRLYEWLFCYAIVTFGVVPIWLQPGLSVHEGMKDDPEYIKNSISKYLMNLSEKNIISCK